ncbi:MAG: ABC transporter permease [Bacteroidia bacterium]
MSGPIVKVAVAGIAAGVAVMILTLAVMSGFQKEIRKKVIGFGSHIQITGIDTNESFENDSINADQPSVREAAKIPGVRHVQSFATKAGIIKFSEQLMGVVLKGVGKDFDWNFFSQHLKEGEILRFADTASDRVLVSRYIADKMNLQVGKKFRMFFLRENETKQRAFRVAGIYETGLYDGFDDRFLICDIREVQRLNGWSESAVGGFEVLVDNFDNITAITDEVRNTLDMNLDAVSVRELNPQIFSWLDILDVNALIIIVLMLFVSMINMISALIIMILDRTNMIGILKALGSADRSIMRIFLRQAVKLISFGLILGNVVGLLLCWIQQRTGIVTLDQESYYVKEVPVDVSWIHLLTLNGATMLLCIISLLLPAMIVSRISPVKAIRFS